jgi:hypothetical protein
MRYEFSHGVGLNMSLFAVPLTAGTKADRIPVDCEATVPVGAYDTGELEVTN